MKFRIGLAALLVLASLPAFAQSAAPSPQHPFSVEAVGGLSAGQGDAGGSIGGRVSFDVTDRVAVEARGIHAARGSGESGTELSAAMLLTVARTAKAAPYVVVGGGMYRSSFDLGDARFFGMMSGQYAAGMQFVSIQGMPGYAMMGAGTNYRGMMWQGAWTGPTFTASQMPMFYANRLGPMTVPTNGGWSMRSFTDPAVTIGGGLKVNLTRRMFLSPDVRGLIVLAGGDHMALMTMNIGFGVRF